MTEFNGGRITECYTCRVAVELVSDILPTACHWDKYPTRESHFSVDQLGAYLVPGLRFRFDTRCRDLTTHVVGQKRSHLHWLLAGRKGGRLRRREVCFRNTEAPAKRETVIEVCQCGECKGHVVHRHDSLHTAAEKD